MSIKQKSRPLTACTGPWFFGLGYGARLLAPLFTRPAAWRVLDAVIGVVVVLADSFVRQISDEGGTGQTA
jgi:arginine exporter protein ArgO